MVIFVPVTEKVTTLESVVTELELMTKPTTARPVNTDLPATSAEQGTTSGVKTTSELTETLKTSPTTTGTVQQTQQKKIKLHSKEIGRVKGVVKH